MKILLVILLVLSQSACAKKEIIGDVINPINVYTVVVGDYSYKVFEWVPPDNRNMRCMHEMDNVYSGITCYSIK